MNPPPFRRCLLFHPFCCHFLTDLPCETDLPTEALTTGLPAVSSGRGRFASVRWGRLAKQLSGSIHARRIAATIDTPDPLRPLSPSFFTGPRSPSQLRSPTSSKVPHFHLPGDPVVMNSGGRTRSRSSSLEANASLSTEVATSLSPRDPRRSHFSPEMEWQHLGSDTLYQGVLFDRELAKSPILQGGDSLSMYSHESVEDPVVKSARYRKNMRFFVDDDRFVHLFSLPSTTLRET